MNMGSKKLKGKSKKLTLKFFLLPFAFSLGLPSGQALAFKIMEPTENALLKSGETITVKVDLGGDRGVIRARYYWYGEQDETLVQEEQTTSVGTIVAPAVLTSTAQNDPPFGGRLKVPADAIGTMRLLGVGEISRGRLEARSTFDEILVKVEPSAELQSIEFETDRVLTIDTLGKTLEIPVVGLFSDGVTRRLTAPSTGTIYYSSDEKVIKVYPDGLMQAIANGKAVVTASNRGKAGQLSVVVESTGDPNQLPVADAGPSRTVKAGTKVELNGLKSHDPEGEALFYAWSQVRGSKVPLLDVNMPRASFLAPQVSSERLFRFKLRVTDKKGADSLPAFVDLRVKP
jgi:hypothetical protein